jgi:glycosyltransferase involved in cell wall biosynthesis
MKIIYFGIYSKGREYPRNRNIIEGLRRNGAEVVEVHFPMAGTFTDRLKAAKRLAPAMRFACKLLASYIALSWQFIRAPEADAVIVGHPGYFHIHLARLLRFLFGKRSVLAHDVFFPLHDALVFDRGLVPETSWIARLIHRFERSCCRAADVYLIDTREHCRFLSKEFGLPSEKISRIFVGPTIVGAPAPVSAEEAKPFNVLFVGTYIPLHGVDVILDAAHRLSCDEDIRFRLVGSGQLAGAMRKQADRLALANTVFEDWVPTEKLLNIIRSCDLALGIFGTTPKTDRVIPSKVFDICAAGVPLVSAATPAMREVFTHLENAYLVPAGNPQALADAIRKLKCDPELRNRMAQSAFQIGQTLFSQMEIGREVIGVIAAHSRDRFSGRV